MMSQPDECFNLPTLEFNKFRELGVDPESNASIVQYKDDLVFLPSTSSAPQSTSSSSQFTNIRKGAIVGFGPDGFYYHHQHQHNSESKQLKQHSQVKQQTVRQNSYDSTTNATTASRQKKLLVKKHSAPELLVSSRRFASDWSWTLERRLVPDSKWIKRSQSSSNYENHIYENLTYLPEEKPLVVEKVKNSNKSSEEVEGIYENVCDKCDRIYNGDLCKNCGNNSVPHCDEVKKKRSIGEFFNSLKRRQKKSSPKKLEIVHNVDGFEGPFKANQTFDLNEISVLKELHRKQQIPDLQQQPEVGELSNDPLNIYENIPPLETLSAPSSEAIPEFPRNLSESELVVVSRDKDDFYCTIQSSVNLSLSSWMTSLQWETHGYDSTESSSIHSYVKHIPSQTFNDFSECHFPSRSRAVDGCLSSDNDDNEAEALNSQIDCFKSQVRRNLEKIHSVRSAQNYSEITLRRETPIIITLKDYLYEESNATSGDNHNVVVVEEIPQIFKVEPKIIPKKHMREAPRLCFRRNAITLTSHNYVKFQLITNTILSITLNRTVLFEVDKRALLKGVLLVNKTTVRKNRQALRQIFRYRDSIGDIIMGVLTLVDSLNQTSMDGREAVLKSNPTGNNLNVVGSRSDLQNMELNIKLPSIEENTKDDIEEVTPEDIYQPIWKSYTMGIGQESTQDTFDGSYNTEDFYETVDNSEWEVAEEFQFGNSRESLLRGSTTSGSTLDLQHESDYSEENIYEDIPEKITLQSEDISRRICILFDPKNSLNNQFIFNYSGSQHIFHKPVPPPPPPRRKITAHAPRRHVAIPLLRVENVVCESEKFLNDERQANDGDRQEKRKEEAVVAVNNSQMPKTHQGGKVVYSIPDSVLAWKFMLLDVLYSEDEEDVMMSVPNLLDINYDSPIVPMETKKLPSLRVPSKESKIQKTNPLNPRKYIMAGRLNIDEQREGFLHKSISGSYKKIEFGSVDNLNVLSKSKSASSILSTSPTKKSPRFLRFRPISPREDGAKGDKQKALIFGGDLNTLRLDPDTGVPKFVTECIRLLELPENITTNGIYRASGNKNSIELVKKKMNEKHNIRKDLVWQFLEKQDVHTLTGSLKLFFRELTAQLIPDSLFDKMPQELDKIENLPAIRLALDRLEELPKATLKFLIKHLTVVTANSSENLMTSSNLSICWGACIFALSATTFDSFESGNIIRKNLFVKVLIDHYDQIFGAE